jgi:hypothetical protein
LLASAFIRYSSALRAEGKFQSLSALIFHFVTSIGISSRQDVCYALVGVEALACALPANNRMQEKPMAKAQCASLSDLLLLKMR